MDDRVDNSFNIASTIRPIRRKGQTRKIKRLATAGQEVWIPDLLTYVAAQMRHFRPPGWRSGA